ETFNLPSLKGSMGGNKSTRRRFVISVERFTSEILAYGRS
ncbi:MAG: hypothetical protein ACI90M_004562, partial [Candidatus Azotimanducaceae bacterium]